MIGLKGDENRTVWPLRVSKESTPHPEHVKMIMRLNFVYYPLFDSLNVLEVGDLIFFCESSDLEELSCHMFDHLVV